MLRINLQRNASAAKSYYASPAEYYAAGEQEQVGEWSGLAAGRLGLSGEIQKHHFERLCDNRHPFSNERLTARMRADRRIGYDFNFHVCKSLSLLYGLTGDPAILAAMRWAVRTTMEAMEQGVKVRVRKHGRDTERVVGNWAVMEAIHFTARPVKGVIDPHLHIHCFVPNVCWDHVEKQWKAIDVASVHEDAPQWKAMFHRLLGRRLSKLGHAVAWKGDAFEIEGIGRDTIERFSGRTNRINQVAQERGIADARDKDRLGALTRERKRKDATMPQLRAQWRERLTDEERASIAQAALSHRHTGGGRESRPYDLAAWERSRHDFIRQGQRRAAYEHMRAARNVTGGTAR